MAKINVYAHTTGKRLNTVEINALPKEVRENKAKLKVASKGDFKLHGYFTKEEGKGKEVASIMAAGNKVYFDRSELNDDEVVEIKEANFSRLARSRMTKAVKSFHSLINTANSAMYAWSEEQATIILDTLGAELVELERKLRKVAAEKEEKGYTFTGF